MLASSIAHAASERDVNLFVDLQAVNLFLVHCSWNGHCAVEAQIACLLHLQENRRKATPAKLSNTKRTFCGTPSGSASKMFRLGASNATLGSSRRVGTPDSKNTQLAHGGTPVRAGAAVSAAKSIRRRSLKAQV